MSIIQTGLSALLNEPPKWLPDLRIGLLCNPASVNEKFIHSRKLIEDRFPARIKALFSPQHGFFAEKQDNMIESDDIVDPVLKAPVFSLYGKTRMPGKEMFDLIDVLLVDLQDAGTRVYTFIYTMSFCMELASKTGKKVVILDRPNPVSGAKIEGNLLKEEYSSFVGRHPIPMRHGLTIGELAKLFNKEFKIGCDLEVILMKGWQRRMYYKDTGLFWVAPSPNLPTPASAVVYPGQVIWEGTNISEGRGTTQPFEIFGAPFIDPEKILSTIGGSQIPGAFLRPLVFEPTSNKWAKTPCRGFQIHVVEPGLYNSYATTLKLLRAILLHHREEFEWKQPPYEYEYKKMPIDLILGDKSVRERIEKLEPVEQIEESWGDDLKTYMDICREYYLYN